MMGWYECSICGHYRNSDDGCSENPFTECGLVCSDCEAEMDAEFEIALEKRESQIRVLQAVAKIWGAI